MRSVILIMMAASGLLLAACSKPTTPERGDRVAPVPETAEAATIGSEAVLLVPSALPTVIDILGSSPDFSTLVSAIGSADLTEALSDPGPHTIFAPTNEAFASMEPGVLEDLLKPEKKDKLVTLVSYHVVPGTIRSGDLIGKSRNMASLNNKDILVDATGNEIRVNTATVAMADIEAANGLIHVIDQVLVPRFSE
ncbi:fasciclin domain-containing protein [Hyphomonas sp.]|uniref:fasciclin domain-containing protein n=1 Tax=Hyphomonas sp. TaxID=87 RepID=UPI0039E2FC8B